MPHTGLRGVGEAVEEERLESLFGSAFWIDLTKFGRTLGGKNVCQTPVVFQKVPDEIFGDFQEFDDPKM